MQGAEQHPWLQAAADAHTYTPIWRESICFRSAQAVLRHGLLFSP